MAISFPALEEKRAELKRIFDEAGDDFDLSRVTVKNHHTATEKAQYIKKLNSEIDDLKRVAEAAEIGGYGHESGDGARPASRGNTGGHSLKGAETLRKDQSFVQWGRDNGHGNRDHEGLSFDRLIRGMATGKWRDADAERKALSEGTLSAGGYLVPTPLAGNVIDLARNQMRVAQAGATFVPMTAQTLKIARLTGEGSPGWRNENSAITAADMTFDSVTFQARSLNRLVTMSVELFEDSDPSASNVIANSFAQQIALEMDRVALRGTGTAPEPRGVANTAGVTTTGHGANGSAISNYDFHLDAVGAVRNANFEPGAHIQAPRTNTSLSKLKEATTNAYLQPPAGMLPMLPTRQVPVNLTVGSSSDCSEIYTGDWSQLAIGIRTEFRIEFLRERYADNGQVAFLAWLRGDVQLLQPSAFVVDVGVRS
ncbi:phage major capsid protein [Streptomyces kanamyceticus]|uniref:Phage major capsid protein n=1 Tax=Streptomyces kanamyceticus TaxID=1967 RepID=A0A5J6G9W9_STRKN|nr:phage major capsid protein [Streptomyces kanamyceticus]QEU91372.1 phage major capsid protein [Streptomyces kanamyceticus]